MSPARFRWGMALILVGLLILLHNSGLLEQYFWASYIGLIPFILIAVGIEKIFTRTRVQFLSYLTTLAMFIGALFLAFEPQGAIYALDLDFFDEMSIEEWADDDVDSVRAIINCENSDLSIRRPNSDGRPDALFAAYFEELTPKPEYKSYVDGRTALVELSPGSKRLLGGVVHIDTDVPDDWDLRFTRDLPLDLSCYGGESCDIYLNLDSIRARQLHIESIDGRVTLRLGSLEDEVNAYISGEDSRLWLYLPGELGLKVSGDIDSELLEELGLTKVNGSYVNARYDSVPQRLNITLDGSFRTLVIGEP